MKKILFLSIVFILMLSRWSSASGESTPKKKDGDLVKAVVQEKKDGILTARMIYMSDGLKVSGELYMDDSKLNQPCVILCHDGISGISKEHRLSSIRLAKAGYVVFSPSYRGEDDSEGEVEIAKGEVRDVLNAITLVKRVKQVDGGRIALAGASHGALICALAASRTDKVKALVLAYGVMDIYKWWYYLKENDKLGKDKITRQTYGDGPEDRPKSFAIRNAVSFAHGIKCPVLILQGAKDDIVPPEQAEYMKQVLDRHKIPNITRIYPDALHGFLIYVPFLKDPTIEQAEKDQTEEAWKEMISFLDKNLKAGK